MGGSGPISLSLRKSVPLVASRICFLARQDCSGPPVLRRLPRVSLSDPSGETRGGGGGHCGSVSRRLLPGAGGGKCSSGAAGGERSCLDPAGDDGLLLVAAEAAAPPHPAGLVRGACGIRSTGVDLLRLICLLIGFLFSKSKSHLSGRTKTRQAAREGTGAGAGRRGQSGMSESVFE